MNSPIAQAVVLSAGLGTRLGDLTKNAPKVMLPVAGKPLLEHHVEQFSKHGVKEFFVNLHYLPQVIRNHFGDGEKFGVRIHYALEPELLGTAGALKNFQFQLDDAFFVIYGDVFSQVDYSRMAEAFRQKKDALGLALIGTTDHPEDSDLVEVAQDLRFLNIHPKPHASLPENAKAVRGLYIMTKKILELIPSKEYCEMDHQLLPKIVAEGCNFFGYEIAEYVRDIGTPARYEEVREYAREGRGKHESTPTFLV